MQLNLKMKCSAVFSFIFMSNILAATANETPFFNRPMNNPNWERGTWPDINITPITFQPEILSRLGSETCSCIEARLCPEFLDLLQYRSSNSEQLRRLTCGFKEFSPLVCCNQVLLYHPSYLATTERYTQPNSQVPREYNRNCNPLHRSITTVQPRINPSTTPHHAPGNYFSNVERGQETTSENKPYFQSPSTRDPNGESGPFNRNSFFQNRNFQSEDNDFVTPNPFIYTAPAIYTNPNFQTNIPLTPRAFPDYYVRTHDVYNQDNNPHGFPDKQGFPNKPSLVHQPYHPDYKPIEPHKPISPGYWNRENQSPNLQPYPSRSNSGEHFFNHNSGGYPTHNFKENGHDHNNIQPNQNYPINYIPNDYPDYPLHPPQHHDFHLNNPSSGYFPKKENSYPPHPSTEVDEHGFGDQNFPHQFHNHHPAFPGEHYPMFNPEEPWFPHKHPSHHPFGKDGTPIQPSFHDEKHNGSYPTEIPLPIPNFDEPVGGSRNKSISSDIVPALNTSNSPGKKDIFPNTSEAEGRDWKRRRLLPTDKCGVVSIGERIVGGKTALLGAYPWVARIGYTRSGSDKILYRCGGSLVNDRYVVTAAHCVTGLPGDLQLASVRLGELDERTDPDCDQSECADPVEDFLPNVTKVHEGYDKPKFRNDLALIRLDRPVNFTAYISPICLPFESLRNKSYTGLTSVVAGWGATDLGMTNSSPVLQWVRVTVLPVMECAKAFSERAGTQLGPGQICAGGERGRDSCEGDSGGPLMRGEQLDPDDFQRYVLVGLVSFGARRCGSENLPGVYTDIPAYLDWILDNIEP